MTDIASLFEWQAQPYNRWVLFRKNDGEIVDEVRPDAWRTGYLVDSTEKRYVTVEQAKAAALQRQINIFFKMPS